VEDDVPPCDVAKFHRECLGGRLKFRPEHKHGREPDPRVRQAQRFAKTIGLGAVERGQDDEHIHIRQSAQPALDRAAEEDHRSEIAAKCAACRLDEITDLLLDSVGEAFREGGIHAAAA
jgi:hypothetical protein